MMETNVLFAAALVVCPALAAVTSHPFVFPFDIYARPVVLNGWVGSVNASSDAEKSDSNHLNWHFNVPPGPRNLISVRFEQLPEDTESLTLGRDGAEPFLKSDVSCYYFASPNQTEPKCSDDQVEQTCEFVVFPGQTNYLNMFYKSTIRPDFSFKFEYVDCQGKSLLAVIPPQSTSATSSTSSTSTSKSSIATSTSDILLSTTGNLATPTPTKDDKNRGEIAPSTPALQSAGIEPTTVAVIAVASILAILLAVFLVICTKRFRRNREETKEDDSRKASTGNSVSPSIDPLYEEIAPKLPNRNSNMREPGYEIPLCVVTENDNSNPSQKYGLTENQLYRKSSDANHTSGESNLVATEKSDPNSISNVLYDMR